jgi:hypothetical protein
MGTTLRALFAVRRTADVKNLAMGPGAEGAKDLILADCLVGHDGAAMFRYLEKMIGGMSAME